MDRGLSYRHNVMRIYSIDTFLNVKGGFNNNLRDVYFVRGLGEPNDFIRKINETDKRMGIEMANARLFYLRVKKLPGLKSIEDSAFYSRAYDEWKNSGKLSLRNVKATDTLLAVLGAAYAQVIEKFKEIKPSASDSIVRNFATKLLFWLDNLMNDHLNSWNERSCIKIIAENVIKDQEYLFYYFLTLIGCDVLMLENRQDIEIAEQLKQLSCAVQLGPYGSAELGEYEPYVPEKKPNDMKMSLEIRSQNRPNKRDAIAQHEDKKTNPAAVMPGISQRTIVNTERGVDKSGSEKTFEELAQLASSIVMISVHDRDGIVISTGSGIMIGRDGYILTNNHVASGGRSYSVRIEDDENTYATDEVIKYNSHLDLAVIRINKKLKPLSIYKGNQKLVRGQKVVAIGSPLGLFNSVSDGIISGFRNIDNVDMIQFTAPISHGSSGGAVLNMQGEVIGISTAGIDRGQNINLAIGYEDIQLFVKGFC